MLIGSAVAAIALLSGTATVAAAHSDDKPTTPRQLAALRAAADGLHDISLAEQHGYTLLTDADGIACIDMPNEGGMGVHWASSALVGDPTIAADQPEALVYAPARDGTLRLAAAQYVVIKAAWDATHPSPPTLFGRDFDLTIAPNRFGLPAFYSLHVWAWKHNPAGTFTMWNPHVTCPAP
jgi:hypothetical protein